ncbi:IS3 family transposase [Legionella birminghamensis]|uniref:IS3 family transposase n=1 Tax=Legionella birminghamensis TaxID=28083 RepID=UPI000A424871
MLKVGFSCSSHGYRRVTTLLNHELKKKGLTCVNHKRVYRIMKKNQFYCRRMAKNKHEHMMGK